MPSEVVIARVMDPTCFSHYGGDETGTISNKRKFSVVYGDNGSLTRKFVGTRGASWMFVFRSLLSFPICCSDELLIQMKEYSQEEITSLQSRINVLCGDSINFTPITAVTTAVTPVYLLGR